MRPPIRWLAPRGRDCHAAPPPAVRRRRRGTRGPPPLPPPSHSGPRAGGGAAHPPPPAPPPAGEPQARPSAEAGSDPRGHFGVTWGVYLCAGKPPLADIILFNPPDLTGRDSVIGLAILAMSGHIQYRGAASGYFYIGISGINRVLLS